MFILTVYGLFSPFYSFKNCTIKILVLRYNSSVFPLESRDTGFSLDKIVKKLTELMDCNL